MSGTDDASAIAHADARQGEPTTRVQVYFQGVLDDACFLYAQANAYKALTGKRVTPAHWKRAVSRLPDPAAFLGGSGATQLGYDAAEEYMERILEALSDPGENFTIEKLSRSAAISDFGSAVDPDSVVVFAYGGQTEFQSPKSHVVCGVAMSGGPPAVLHLACSVAFWSRYLRSGEYFERHHPDTGRWSNDSVRVDSNVVIAPNFRWRITLARDP